MSIQDDRGQNATVDCYIYNVARRFHGGRELDEPTPDQIVASAARFLIDGGEGVAANVLLSCRVSIDWAEGGSNWYHQHRQVTLIGPRAAFDILDEFSNPIRRSIQRAIEAVLPDREGVELVARAEIVPLDPGWRAELLEIARGEGVSNQLAAASKFIPWANLRFRSASEVRIAQELNRRGVMFFPNCRARLPVGKERRNLEPDFLICYEGKWGILEVDGDPFHPPSRASEDHERDRHFRTQGVRVVERFKADECFENYDGVVSKFLDLLTRS
jgi:hypothetical protein